MPNFGRGAPALPTTVCCSGASLGVGARVRAFPAFTTRGEPQIFFAAQHFPTSTLLFQHHKRAVRAGGLWLHTTTRAAGATSGALFGCLSNPLCRIETSRGNNHKSCLAAPLCKLSCQPLATDHEGPDQAQPRPRQSPVPRAAGGHQDTRESVGLISMLKIRLEPLVALPRCGGEWCWCYPLRMRGNSNEIG